MNFFKLFLSTLILLSIVSCVEDDYQEYVAPDELSDIGWLIGTNRLVPEPNRINIDTHISFMDISQGVVHHEWNIEEGNHFLKGNFKQNDTLDNFIDKEAGLISFDPKVHVLFKNEGQNHVRLLNFFNDSVSYKSSAGTTGAVKRDNLWVIDTTFTFDVFGYIKPAFQVFQGDSQVLNFTVDNSADIENIEDWPTVEVEAGSALKFVDLTTAGRPSARSWIYPDGAPTQTNQEDAEISFYRLGTFTGEMRSFRMAPDPTASVITPIPLKVKVIPSSQPFVFSGNLREDENEKISFQVTGEVVPFAGQENNFTVHVKNIDAGFDQEIAVQSAQVSQENGTYIELVLSEPIYNSDNITVAYTNTNDGITSTDTRVLQSFEAQTVRMHFDGTAINNADFASFEQQNTAMNRAFAGPDYWVGGKNDDFGGYVWERVTDKAHHESASMKYETPASTPIPNNVNLFGFGIAKPTGISKGTYRVHYWVYIEPTTTLKAFRFELGNPNKGQATYTMPPFDISNAPKGEWTRVSSTVTIDADMTDLTYRSTLTFYAADNPGVTGAQKMYFDDFSMIELEIRN